MSTLEREEFAYYLNARFWYPCSLLLGLTPYRDVPGYTEKINLMTKNTKDRLSVEIKTRCGKKIYFSYGVIKLDNYDFQQQIDSVRPFFNDTEWVSVISEISGEFAMLCKYYQDVVTKEYLQFMDADDADDFVKLKIDKETTTLYLRKHYAKRVGLMLLVKSSPVTGATEASSTDGGGAVF